MSSAPREIERDLHRWISAMLDGSITPTDRAALAERLDSDTAARRVYIDAVDMHCEIADVLHTEGEAVEAKTYPIYREGCEPRPRDWRRVFIAAIGVAAAILLTAGAVAIYVFAFGAPSVEPRDPKPRARTVATLIGASGTVIVNNDVANPGHEYAAGAHSIASGSAEFMLTSGTTVEMHGRSNLTVHNAMDVTLSNGAARFHCPKSAHGFAVRLLDGHRVVDLGTSFSVVNERGVGTAVYVHDGFVLVGDPQGTTVGITENRLAGLDADGRWVVADTLDAALANAWAAPGAVAALLPHVIEGEGRLVSHDGFAGADAAGRDDRDRAMRFDADGRRDPVQLAGDYEQVTFAAWVKLDTSDAPLRVLAISQVWGPAGHFSWDIRNGDRLCLAVSGNGSPHYHAPIVFDGSHFDRWLHIAVVYDSDRAVVEHYVDGQRVSSESITKAMPLRPRAMTLGHWHEQDPRPLRGAMDDLLMIKAALTAKQVESLYRMGSVETDPQPQGDLP